MLNRRKIEMTEGPIFSSVIIFAIPIVLSGMLQIFFNAADLAIVGWFAPSATAAVGATGSVISLLVNSTMGLSAGVNVLLSRSLGAGDKERSQKIVHNAISISFIAGVILAIVGCIIARPVMNITKCPEGVIDMAVSYLVIYFLGCPAILIYNFGSAILRSKGDTKRPLYFLTVAGVLNVLLNVFFVVVFGMKASGVALATTLSQCVAAYCVIRCLTMQEDETKLELSRLHINKEILFGVIKYGLPSGISSAMYSLSNLQIQTAINSFGEATVAGNSASMSLEGFISAGITAVSVSTLAFMGQNIGARKPERVKRSLFTCLAIGVTYGGILGFSMFLLGRPIISTVYLPKNPAGVDAAMVRAAWMMTAYWIGGAFNVMGNAAQAFGYSMVTMINSIIGVFGIRTIWMQLIYPLNPDLKMIYFCYPITWFLILVANSIVTLYAYRRYKKYGIVK